MFFSKFELSDDIYKIDRSGEHGGAAEDGCHDDRPVELLKDAEDCDRERNEQAELERAGFDAELFAADGDHDAFKDEAAECREEEAEDECERNDLSPIGFVEDRDEVEGWRDAADEEAVSEQEAANDFDE